MKMDTMKSTDNRIDVLLPSCNLDTVSDGRGGIFTWVPKDKIAEFNLLYFRTGKTRGNHFHPEFTEYFLVVQGEGIMVWKESPEAQEHVIHMGKGMCTRAPAGVIHAFYAMTEATCVSLLTKPWDDCDPPIVRSDILEPPPS